MAGGYDTTPHNPTQSPTYLTSPIRTLVGCLGEDTEDDISIHDLLDAYTTLAFRMRVVCASLTGIESTIPALQVLDSRSGPLSHRIQRDLRRALEDPSGSSTPQTGNNTLTGANVDLHGDLLYAARDSSALCQLAIQVVSLIFGVPALHSFFETPLLSQLLHDLLMIARSSDLPSFDGDRTSTLAATVFATIRLPATIMLSNQDAVVTWMGELAAHISPKTNASKIMHHLWSEYPVVCLPHTINVLPEIFSRLVSSDTATRADATVALSGFACALLSMWSSVRSDFKTAILVELRQFLFPEHSPDRGHLPDLQLTHIITRELKEDTAGVPHKGPRWAITVVCCLILLSGHGVFDNHRLCRFVLKTAELVTNRKKKPGSELLMCIWRSLIWAFAQFPEDDDIPPKMNFTGLPASRRESAFKIVKQELRGGTGLCLIASLLYARPGRSGGLSNPDLDKVISVLKAMVSSPSDAIYQEGVSVLERLVGAIGIGGGVVSDESSNAAWTPDDIPIKAMFSRLALDADVSVFSSSVNEANRVALSAVPPLLEQEIQHQWKELLEVWNMCVRRELQGAKLGVLPDGLLHVWQALLLVQTHLTQGKGHLTTSQEYTGFAISAIADFLDWNPSTDAKHPPLSANVVQHRVLSACHQLWSVMKNVFSDAWLSSAAGSLLASVVRHTFDLSTDNVKTSWSEFSASLVSTNAPDLVTRLVAEDEEHRKADIRQELWLLTAKTWTSRKPLPSWMDSVDLLILPLRHWTMEDADVAVWSAILQHAVSQAELASESSLVVFDAIAERGFEDPARLLNAPKIFIHLLSLFNVTGGVPKTSIFLNHVGIVLRDLYFEPEESIPTAVQALGHLRRIIQSCPSDATLHVLYCLTDGVSTWVGDENAVLLIQEHNDVVVPLYCDALDALRKIPMSADTLKALAPFLCSAFVRIPEPGRGPLAFCEFWTDIQLSLNLVNGAYPEEIKAALRASHDVLGIDVLVDISLDSESHSDRLSSAWTSPAKSSPGKPRHAPGENSHDNQAHAWHTTLSPLREKSTPTGSPCTSPVFAPSRSKRRRSHGHAEADSPATPARRRNDDASRSSDYIPSSPMEALRARRLAAGPLSRVAHERPRTASDRPIKRRKLSPPTAPADGPSKHKASSAASSSSSRSKWQFDGVEVEYSGRRTKTTGSSIPKPSKTAAAQILSPEVPSPAAQARTAGPSSDDYDAWEVPICVDDDMDVVPDSQPPCEYDDDSLLPSFMKDHRGKHEQSPDDTEVVLRHDPVDSDDMPLPSSKALGKRPQHPSRNQTAPPSFLREDSPVSAHEHTAAPPLQRAHTAFAQLEGLQNVFDVLQEVGSQLDADQMVAVSTLGHNIGTLMSEKWVRKVRGDGRTRRKK